MGLSTDYLLQIESTLGDSWLPRIYRECILKMRTRTYQFPQFSKHTEPEIHHTLLGVELKIGKRRFLCPDLATARYLAVFARIGCSHVAVPYDITQVSRIADELESSWHRMLLMVHRLTSKRGAAFFTRVRRQLIGKVRDEIAQSGAGARVPEFTAVRKLQNRERRRAD